MHYHSPDGHCELLFRDVRVPAANLLGEEGKGFELAQQRLGPGRVHHCMRTIGQCEVALELMCERALEREAFGKHLADFANVQDWIAESRLEIDQARLLGAAGGAIGWTARATRRRGSTSRRSRWSRRGCRPAWSTARCRCSARWG